MRGDATFYRIAPPLDWRHQHRLMIHEGKLAALRVPAQAIEQLVIEHLGERCNDDLAMALAASPSCPPDNWQRLIERGPSMPLRSVTSGTRISRRCLCG